MKHLHRYLVAGVRAQAQHGKRRHIRRWVRVVDFLGACLILLATYGTLIYVIWQNV